MSFFEWVGNKSDKKTRRSLRESGNVFLMLFGAVGMVGVIGASTMTVMRGPVSTMAQVTKRTIAENNLIATGRLAIIASSSQANNDCDNDLILEPLEPGAVVTGFTGGGRIPSAASAGQQDPWGRDYAYCSWDHGIEIDNAGCGGTGQGRLQGSPAADNYALAVISAGPDGVFNTSCVDYVDATTPLIDRTGGADDIVMGYTYDEATAAAGGLWSLSDPDTAEISNNLSVTDSGGTEQFAFDANSGNLTLGNAGQFPITQTDNLRSFNGSGGTINITSGLSSDSNIATSATVSGATLAASGNTTVGGTLDVTGTSTLNVLNAGASTLGATGVSSLNASGAVTGGSLSTTGTLNAGTSTLGTTNVSSLSAGGLISTTGNVTLGNELTDTVDIAGTLSVTGNTALSTVGTSGLATLSSATVTNATNLNGNVTLGDNTTDTLTINALIGNDLNLNSNKIINVTNPTLAQDAATKQYVDDRVAAGTGFSEQDPQVGNISTSGRWCQSNGTEIICDIPDPRVAGQGDNLGNHTATTNLNMGANRLFNIGGGDASLANGSGYSVLGLETATNIVMDNNEIMARNNGAPSTLLLQADGGNVSIGRNNDATVISNFDTNEGRVIDMADPISAQDAATKAYVDTQVAAGTGFSEQDPQVGNISTSGRWCQSNGTEIICDILDPRVVGQGDNLGAGGSGDLITDNTIDSTEIQNNTLTADDLASNSVGASEIAADAVRASEIQNGSIVATTELSATGTTNSTTFLRGDNTWASVPPGADNLGAGGTTTGDIYATGQDIGRDTGDRLTFQNNSRIEFDVAGTERMRLTITALDLNGNDIIDTDNISFSGTMTDTSDIRLKDNIKPLTEMGALLDKVANIDTISFTMKDDIRKKIEYGVSAQQLETIFPKLVETADDEIGSKSVNYIGLIAPLIEAVKELKTQNEALTIRIQQLEEEKKK